MVGVSQKHLGPSVAKATVASILDCSICPGPHPPRSMSRANFVKLNGMRTSSSYTPMSLCLPFPHTSLGARPPTMSTVQRLFLPLCTLAVLFTFWYFSVPF